MRISDWSSDVCSSDLSNSSRLVLQIDVQHASAVKAIAEILLQAKGGRCEVLLRGRLQDGKVVKVRLGRDFAVDAELAARVGAVPAIIHHVLQAAEPLRLVPGERGLEETTEDCIGRAAGRGRGCKDV